MLTKKEKEEDIRILRFIAACYDIREDVKEYYRENRIYGKIRS